MSDNTVIEHGTEQQQQQQAAPATPAAVPEVLPAREVLRQIQRDSRKDPEAYLDETKVRFGGE